MDAAEGLVSSEIDSDRVNPEWCVGSRVREDVCPPGVVSASCRSVSKSKSAILSSLVISEKKPLELTQVSDSMPQHLVLPG